MSYCVGNTNCVTVGNTNCVGTEQMCEHNICLYAVLLTNK